MRIVRTSHCHNARCGKVSATCGTRASMWNQGTGTAANGSETGESLTAAALRRRSCLLRSISASRMASHVSAASKCTHANFSFFSWVLGLETESRTRTAFPWAVPAAARCCVDVVMWVRRSVEIVESVADSPKHVKRGGREGSELCGETKKHGIERKKPSNVNMHRRCRCGLNSPCLQAHSTEWLGYFSRKSPIALVVHADSRAV